MRMKHGKQGRLNYLQHGPHLFCINRTLTKQRLLVEFSCEFPTLYLHFEIYLLVRSLNFVSSGCHNINGIDKATWNFISAIYNLGWDTLIADKNNHSFRQKVAAQFISKLNKIKPNKNKKKPDKSASFIKLPPPIPAKTPKKVNEISKYFKKNNQPIEKKNTRKLYVQASLSTSNIKEVLKIKETFLSLKVNRIENI